MMQRFLGLQQEQLERLGQERGRLLARIEQEQQREQKLAQLLCEMGEGLDLRQGLVRENYYQMRRNLERLWLQQCDKVALAQQDLNQLERELRAQLGKVKGLELLLQQRAVAAEQLKFRRQQQQLDEFNIQRHGRRH